MSVFIKAKKTQKTLLTMLVLPLSFAAVSFEAPAQKEMERVDSVLDRLEKRILEEEGEGLTFGEKSLNSKDDDKPTIKIRINDNTGKLSGELPETKQLREIAGGIADLENQVEQLSADVQRTRQKILEEARIDNIVLIESRINGEDTASLKMLRAKLDGYVIYGVSEEGGLWIPARAVPLFSGPLQPGTHRLDIEARVGIKEATNMPLNTDISRYVSQSFELRIPDGRQTTKYTVTIDPSTDGTGRATAKIDEATLRSAPPPKITQSVETAPKKLKSVEPASDSEAEIKK